MDRTQDVIECVAEERTKHSDTSTASEGSADESYTPRPPQLSQFKSGQLAPHGVNQDIQRKKFKATYNRKACSAHRGKQGSEDKGFSFSEVKRSFACEYCMRVLYSKEDCHIHEKLHTSATPYQCLFCKTRFKSRDDLEQHEISHRRGKGYQCRFCSHVIESKHEARLHARTHVGKVIPKGNDLYEQVQESGAIRSVYFCKACNQAFEDKAEWMTHEEGHKLDNPYACRFCDNRTFSDEPSLQGHERLHTVERPYLCKYCDKGFREKRQMQTHETKHKYATRYPCRLCERRFPTAFLRDSHENTHTGEKPYACRFCDKRYAYQYLCGNHERREHTKETPYQCSHCDQRFLTSFLRFQHERAAHSNAAPLKCARCAEAFVTQTELCRHARTHKAEGLFQCLLCPKSFKRPSSLTGHKNQHVGKFSCLECGENLPTLIEKKKHQATEHVGPYTCRVCDKELQSMGHLWLHMQCHKLPFRCADCIKFFSSAAQLKQHEQLHVQAYSPCSVPSCGRVFNSVGYLKLHLKHQHPNHRESSSDSADDNEELETVDTENHGESTLCSGDSENLKRVDTEMAQSHALSPMVMSIVKNEHYHESFKMECEEILKTESVDMIKTENDEVLTCAVCEASFTARTEYLRHEQEHFTDSTASTCS